MKIAVFGLGYVGLANAVLLAQHNKVVAYDVLDSKVAMINDRQSPLLDTEIIDFLQNRDLDLLATTDKNETLQDADFAIIATPTNYDVEKNLFDTSSVEGVIADVAKLSPKTTVVIKSTIPIGFVVAISKKYPDLHLIFAPEFLREGKALYDNLYPSRIVIGDNQSQKKDGVYVGSEAGRTLARLLTEGALKENIEVLYMPTTEAESVKLFANTYLALRVAYFNELDTFAELNNLDSSAIITGVSLDERIGVHYNNPSFGYGGYCLPKDTKQLKANFEGVPSDIIPAIVKANTTRKDHLVKQILARNPKVVGIYRLTMKKNSDNWRSAAVFGLIQRLQQHGVTTIIYEPTATEEMIAGSQVINDQESFFKKADLIITNRLTKKLEAVKNKVYTRDIFNRD